MNTWHSYLIEDLEVVRATEGLTVHTPLMVGVDIAVGISRQRRWAIGTGGVIKSTEWFMVKRKNMKAELSRERH